MATARHRTTPRDPHINLAEGTDAPAFRWLAACLLFGARISQDIGTAYAELDQLGVLTPGGLA
jgi:hypothetical protein